MHHACTLINPQAGSLGRKLASSILLDLLCQHGFVGSNIAWPDLDSLLIAHPDLISDLVNQTEVVRYQHQATLVCLDCVSQCVNRLNIQMVSRLVEQQHVGIAHANHCEHQARLLAIGQHADLRSLLTTGDGETTQVCSPLLKIAGELLVVRELVHEELEHSHVVVECFHRMLCKATDGHVGMAGHRSLSCSKIASHQLDQSRLASTVGTHQRNTRVAVHAKVQVTVERFAPRIAEGDVDERQHRGSELRARGELQGEPGLAMHGLGEASSLHLVDNLLLGLGLLHQVAESTARSDELLQVLDVVLLLLVLLGLNNLVLGNSFLEGVIVTGVVGQPLLREPDDVVAHTVQEILRVGNDDQALRVGLQVILEPHTCLQIQMVGRLVEQQKRRGSKQRTCKRHTHAPTTGHILGHFAHHVAAKTQTVQKLGSTDFESGRVQLTQALVNLIEALVLRALILHDLISKVLESVDLLLDVVNDGLQRGHLGRIDLRSQVVQRHVRWNWDLTVGKHLQKVGLSAAVLSQKTVTATDGQLDTAILDKLNSVQAHGEAIDLDIASSRP
mmetsp:Transcript_22868/g.53363  ORF Transcript_22868/g.53363 Transcript_22868/m.53363 type:complete len:560 (-) Transcript_22868:232-1911(-)